MDAITAAAVTAGARRAEGVVSRVLGPSADVLGNWLAQRTEYRLNNIRKIGEAAERKQKVGDEGSIPPRVVHQILEDGSYCDDELMAEYFGGALAASKTPHGRDDRAVTWAKLIASLSALEIRAHFILYRIWATALQQRGDLELSNLNVVTQQAQLHLPYAAFGQLLVEDSGIPFEQGIRHSLFGLARNQLVAIVGWGHNATVFHPIGITARFDPAVIVAPTVSGIELYGWALGYPGFAPEEMSHAKASVKFDGVPAFATFELPNMPPCPTFILGSPTPEELDREQ